MSRDSPLPLVLRILSYPIVFLSFSFALRLLESTGPYHHKTVTAHGPRETLTVIPF